MTGLPKCTIIINNNQYKGNNLHEILVGYNRPNLLFSKE